MRMGYGMRWHKQTNTMNDNAPFYRQLLGLVGKAGRGLKDFFVDAPNRRGQAMLDAERARNEAMMRENGLMGRDGTVVPPQNPDLFRSPVPQIIADPMVSFMERLAAARSRAPQAAQPDTLEQRMLNSYTNVNQ